MLIWKDVLHYAQTVNPTPPRRVSKTQSQWYAILKRDIYRVTREAATERPFSSPLCTVFEPGIYACACCGEPLFDATKKFDSGSGWPAFTQPVDITVVAYQMDSSHNMQRVEVLCNVCDAHLGHVFPDGPSPSGLRYCINALALQKAI